MSDHDADLDRFRIRPDAEVIEDDDDLDANPITLPDGTVLDNAGAEAYGQAVADRAAAKRGRPSLSGTGEHSPRISVRLPDDVLAHFRLYAELTGMSVSALARQALLDFDAGIVEATSEPDEEQAAKAAAVGKAVAAALGGRVVVHVDEM